MARCFAALTWPSHAVVSPITERVNSKK